MTRFDKLVDIKRGVSYLLHMKLDEYLKLLKATEKKTLMQLQDELARLCDCTPNALKHYRYGIRRPRIEIALKIEKATDGMVTRRDLLPEYFEELAN